MLRGIIRLDLNSDYILGEVTKELDSPLIVTHEECYKDDTITFVMEIPKDCDQIAERLAASEAVLRVETLSDLMLLVRKQSCGAIPIIQKHHGFLCGVDRAFGTERTFDILVFNRQDIRNISDELSNLGVSSIEKLTSVAESQPHLSDRQIEVVNTALDAGYFDWPRKIEAVDLAEELGITHSTLLEHLRKAEKTLLQQALMGRMHRPYSGRAVV